MFDFLKSQNRLKTISDSIVFTDKNRYRPTDKVRITKTLTKSTDISQTIFDICSALSDDFLIFVDFHFLFVIPENEEEDGATFKFQGGSKASSMNDVIKITSSEDFNLFYEQFRTMSQADFLNSVFEHHSELFNYRGSGLMPHSLLSLLLHIQKI